MKVHIIDYGMGNLASVCSAFRHIGAEPVTATSPDDLNEATHVVLPGVGSFAKAMENLNAAGWPAALRAIAAEGKVCLLGICLGMQLLADQGSEHGDTQGLGLVPGTICHLNTRSETQAQSLLIPHVGWNELHVALADDPLLGGIENQTDFYFVHSYFFDAADEAHVVARTPYGFEFPSVVRAGCVWGAQFHPEKSGTAGFALLKNFIGLSGKAASSC